jgi:hypothetical protein
MNLHAYNQSTPTHIEVEVGGGHSTAQNRAETSTSFLASCKPAMIEVGWIFCFTSSFACYKGVKHTQHSAQPTCVQ